MDGTPDLAPPGQIGMARRLDDGRGRYIEFCKASFPRGQTLSGLKIVIDCANGAAYATAPEVLWELGAEVVRMGVSPNGENINKDCGSTDPAACRQAVLDNDADLGIALDGDADRVHIIDEKGQVVDGDQIMGLIATRWAGQGLLAHNTLVTTVMSNLGLERLLAGRKIGMVRTQVGDRYEQSGHIVLSDYVTTGDGLLAGLQVLNVLVAEGRPASEVCALFDPYPQRLRSIRFNQAARPLEDAGVKAAITSGEARLAASGRLVIRASGTEPVIRVMGEAENPDLLAEVVEDICTAVERVAG
jgi:phosphoglucosamine mutase